MIHIFTVHWLNADWVKLQADFIRRHVDAPHRTYAYYTGIPASAMADFDTALETDIRDHATKLNLLAERVINGGASPNDILVFLDGDAFPVRPIWKALEAGLARYPLMAIQRTEQHDLQPHPSFCATTVRFWQEIVGDWSRGYEWHVIDNHSRTDVGGNLLQCLEERGVEWLPLHRSCSLTRHGLFHGVYAGLIYHHGAGFRMPWTTYDGMRWRLCVWNPAKQRWRARFIRVVSLPFALWNQCVSRAIFNRLRSGAERFEEVGEFELPAPREERKDAMS